MSNRRIRRAAARHRQPVVFDPRRLVQYSPQAREAMALVAESASAVVDPPADVGEAVSSRPWSDFSPSDYSPQQWRRACILHRRPASGQDPDTKTLHSLPVREPSGALNRNGVHAAASRIHSTDASADLKRTAARTLVGLYRGQLDEDPPPRLLSLAGMSESASARAEVCEVGAVEARSSRPGRMQIQLIRAGWSVNGRYYPAAVLRRDGPQAFPSGTQAFIDHATDDEDAERPAGSLTRLAAVQTTDARWDQDRNALVAEVRLFQPWREQLTDMAEHIGMSIRAWVMGEHGEAEGRQGMIVSELAEGRSVDFVTRPAAGGAILSVLEDARPQLAEEARNVGGWLESRIHLAFTQLGDDLYGHGRLSRDERIALSQAIGDALQAWTSRVEADAPQLFERDLYDEPSPAEQPAEETTDPSGDTGPVDASPAAAGPVAEDAATPALAAETITDLTRIDRLLGRITDMPVDAGIGQTAGGSPPTATTTEREAPMPEAQDGARAPDQAGAVTEARTASEAQLAVITQERDQYRSRAHSLAEALTEAQNAQRQAEAERDQAVTEMRRYRANETGRLAVDRLLAAAESGVPEAMQTHIGPRVHERIQDRVPLADTGEVDMAALEAQVASAIRTERVHAAQLLEAQGVGRVQGLGADGDPTMQMTAKQFDEQVSRLFASIGLDESTVSLATKGRD